MKRKISSDTSNLHKIFKILSGMGLGASSTFYQKTALPPARVLPLSRIFFPHRSTIITDIRAMHLNREKDTSKTYGEKDKVLVTSFFFFFSLLIFFSIPLKDIPISE